MNSLYFLESFSIFSFNLFTRKYNFLIFCPKIYLILTNCCRNSINKLSNHILYYYIGPILQNRKLKLVEDIFDQCNNDIDCPIGLICEKNTCRKPGPVPIGIIGIHTEFSKIISYFWQIGLILSWSTPSRLLLENQI